MSYDASYQVGISANNSKKIRSALGNSHILADIDLDVFKIKIDTTITDVTGSTSYKYYCTVKHDLVAIHSDGTVQHFVNQNLGYNTLNFVKSGIWTLQFDNVGLVGFRYSNNTTTDAKKLKELVQWGTYKWTSIQQLMNGCVNATFTATDIPDFSLLTNGQEAFLNMTSVTTPPNFGSNTFSLLTNGYGMFQNWSACTSPMNTSSWTLIALTNGSFMFQNWSSCTSPMNTSSWTLIALTNGQSMFVGWSSCTTPMNTSTWTLLALTNGAFMFYGWSSCTTPMNTSSWTLSALTSGASMFYNWSSAVGTMECGTWGLGNCTTLLNTFTYCKFTINNLELCDLSKVLNFGLSFWYSNDSKIGNFGGVNFNKNIILDYFYQESATWKYPKLWTDATLNQMRSKLVGTGRTEANKTLRFIAQRTTASDTAVADMIADGWTISGLYY